MPVECQPTPEDFIGLELENRGTGSRNPVRFSSTAGVAGVARRSGKAPALHREHTAPLHEADLKSLKPQWKWPDETEGGFWRTTKADTPGRQWNVVPFRALVLAFTVADSDVKKIFGNLAWNSETFPKTLL